MVRELAHAFNTMPQQHESDVNNNKRLVKVTNHFFKMVAFFLDNLYLAWQVDLPFRWGRDCSVVAAFIEALQTKRVLRQSIFHQSSGKDQFRIMASNPDLGHNSLPFVINIEHSAHNDNNFDEPVVRLVDLAFMSKYIIYSSIALQQTPLSTLQVSRTRTTSFVAELVNVDGYIQRLMEHSERFSRGLASVHDPMRFLMIELNYIRSFQHVYPTNYPNYFSRYLAGQLAATKRDHFSVSILLKQQHQETSAFMITTKDEADRLVINMIEISYKIDFDLGRTLIGKPLLTKSLPKNEILVLNVFVGFAHNIQEFSDPENRAHDYIRKQVVASRVTLKDLHELFTFKPLPFI